MRQLNQPTAPTPSKAPTAFASFLKDNTPRLKREHPHLSGKERMQLAARLYRAQATPARGADVPSAAAATAAGAAAAGPRTTPARSKTESETSEVGEEEEEEGEEGAGAPRRLSFETAEAVDAEPDTQSSLSNALPRMRTTMKDLEALISKLQL